VELKFKTTNIVVFVEGIQSSFVINVIDVNFVVFRDFEVVLYVELLNPLRVQVVINHLRHA